MFKDVFLHSPHGKDVLSLIKRASDYDNATTLRADDRNQMYWLGRASIFAEIKELLEYDE